MLLCLFACRAERPRAVTGVIFDPEVVRLGVSGDNWCQTWGTDGDVYASLCDGVGWRKDAVRDRDYQNNRIYRISGGPDVESFRASKLEGSPDYSRAALPRKWTEKERKEKSRSAWTWYAYGIVSVNGNLFQYISHPEELNAWGWFDGAQLIWRPKGETSWKRWNQTDAHDEDRWFAGQGGNQLLFHNEPDYAFSFITIAQYGQDYSDNTDGYVYLYAPNGPHKVHELNMARVKTEHLLDRTQYEYFVRHGADSTPEWARNDINARGVVHSFPEDWGWYSWSPSVVWNKGLGLFIMATAGTQRPGTGDPMDSYMHHETGSLMMLWAEHPWGPWRQFHWDEVWDSDHTDNRLYEAQLSPKWIFDNGRTMYLIYSDARDHHSTNYRWNMQKITLLVE